MRGRGEYPGYWPALAERLKAEAGWRCTVCGHVHDPGSGHTLTVHHLDGNKGNCAESNLLVCCQRCHLVIQAKYRVGQGWLPGLRAGWAVGR